MAFSNRLVGASRKVGASCALLLLLLGLPAGCVTIVDNEGIEGAVVVDGYDKEAQLNNVGFLTDGLNRRVAVNHQGANRTATKTLKVYVVFRNRTDYPQTIQARVQFFGPAREPNEGPSAWDIVHLQPNVIQTWEAYSTTTNAEYYYVEVQEIP